MHLAVRLFLGTALACAAGCGRTRYRPLEDDLDAALGSTADVPFDVGSSIDADRDAAMMDVPPIDAGGDARLPDVPVDAFTADAGGDTGGDAGSDAPSDAPSDAGRPALDCTMEFLEFRFDGDYLESADRAVLTAMGDGNSFVEGHTGQALALDGRGFARIADGPIGQIMLQDGLTMEAWVWVDSALAEGRIIDRMTPGRVDGSLLDIHLTQARMYAGLQGAYGAVLPVGRWVHVAAVRNVDAITLYLDGLPSGGNPSIRTPDDNGRPITIGADSDGLTRLVGRLDDVRIYCRALSSEEVRMHAGL